MGFGKRSKGTPRTQTVRSRNDGSDRLLSLWSRPIARVSSGAIKAWTRRSTRCYWSRDLRRSGESAARGGQRYGALERLELAPQELWTWFSCLVSDIGLFFVEFRAFGDTFILCVKGSTDFVLPMFDVVSGTSSIKDEIFQGN